MMLRSDSELADATGMQTALDDFRDGAGGDVNIVLISSFPDTPD